MGGDCGIPDNSLMSDPTPLLHLLIPGAGLPAVAPDAAARSTPALPHLTQLLQYMDATSLIECGDDSLSMPFELALAQLHGLPAQAGHIPWAAFETGTVGTPCAWVQPCHWQLGATHMLLSDPAGLNLDETSSRALMAAAAPYFQDDGMILSYHQPGRWLASGEVFRDLPARSLDRVIGYRVSPALFDDAGPRGARLRRLQNEIQMLFHTHPVNEARQDQRQLPVNAFWISGAGELAHLPAARPGLLVDNRLPAAALRGDPLAQAQAWAAVDADACARLLAQLRQGHAIGLTLCGERRARGYTVAPKSLFDRIKHVLGLKPPSLGLETL